ncbi:3515_t:CDS:2 [Acaulospora colombiana]|uniref:3515_t:CDS:1 n=1 Tax=Acaulospora colombiana TaxID=27376 RepID=A0ACA9LU97_9GLOM|nr:3515_t:CDS:2 [Acaulospora colombiana]
MSERFFPETKAIEMYRKACEANDVRNPEVFQEFMVTINLKLNTVDLEFRKSHDEIDGKAVWALVNTNGDEVAKLATEYSPVEIAYFKHLIELIVTADDEAFSISSITALKEASKLKATITKNTAENLLQRFVDDKWLILSPGGRYSLSQRTILELQVYLKEEFEENLIECTLCYDIVTQGQREKICPTCKIPWKESNEIGEPRSKSGATRSRRRDWRNTIDSDQDDRLQDDS